MQEAKSNKELGEKRINRKQKFPTQMFVTAGIMSMFMVFVISSVFAQANAPCINSYSLHNKVVVNTTNPSQQATQGDQPIVICNRNNQQIGWLTWIFKQSGNVEFHYLDLLELLSRK
jgi:ABC-type phosphate transport system permease subunit